MKIKSILILSLLVTALGIGGCKKESVDESRKNIEIQNEQLDSVLEDYNISKNEGKILNTLIIDSIKQGGKISLDTKVGVLSKEYIGYVNPSILQIYEAYALEYDESLEYDDNGVLLPNQKTKNEYVSELLDNNYEVYDFLDSDKGVLEKTFIFRLPYGDVYRLEFHILGGVCFDIQAYNRS